MSCTICNQSGLSHTPRLPIAAVHRYSCIKSRGRQDYSATGRGRAKQLIYGVSRPKIDTLLVRFKTENAPDVSEGFVLPLSYQQLLGFKSGAAPRDSDISRAYEQMLKSAMVPGYSKAMLHGREELLRIAKCGILESKGKGVAARPEIYIPQDLAVIALALLAEVGQSMLVLKVGEQLLSIQNLENSAGSRNDVLLSMALAYCNLAGEALESGDKATTACYCLEEALQLLHSVGSPPLAPELAQEIRGSLRSLRAPSILEELLGSCSSDGSVASVERRDTAVRSLRELLKDSGNAFGAVKARIGSVLGVKFDEASSPELQLSEETIQQMMDNLTCQELVQLLEWEHVAKNAAGNTWLYKGLLETAAVAHIVAGFTERQPAYVKTATVILKHVQPSAEVLVMQGICQLLLGSVQVSTQLLKQAESTARREAEQEARHTTEWGASAYSFVVANSPGGEDGLLPGLCVFTEKWLTKVAFPIFRDTAAASPSGSLSMYFDDTRVEALITVYDEKGGVNGGLVETLTSAFTDSTSSSSSPSKKLLMAAGVLAAAVGVFFMGSLLMRGSGNGQGVQILSGAINRRSNTAVQSIAPVQAERLDRHDMAERLIMNWQVVKQACLGPSFDSTSLSSVLTGQALKEARQRAASFKEQGCYMVYKLNKCQVTDMAPLRTDGSGPICLTANLDESASMIGRDGQAADSYRSSYQARYVAERSDKDGVWRISKVSVVGEAESAGRS